MKTLFLIGVIIVTLCSIGAGLTFLVIAGLYVFQSAPYLQSMTFATLGGGLMLTALVGLQAARWMVDSTKKSNTFTAHSPIKDVESPGVVSFEDNPFMTAAEQFRRYKEGR